MNDIVYAAIVAAIVTLIGVPITIWMSPGHTPPEWFWTRFVPVYYVFSFLLQIALNFLRGKGWLPWA